MIPKAAFACFLALYGVGASASAFAADAKRSRGNPAAIQKSYQKGQEAFEAKRFEEAEALLNQLLIKQPDHVPSKTLLVRVLYQLKKLNEASAVCGDLDIETLDPDASYECGQAAFRTNNFGLALSAFKHIPNGHSLYDLAGYYGGISAFKKGDYAAAVDMFEQAVVLPSKLVRSQKLYKKEAERALLNRQKHELQSGIDAPAKAEKPYMILDTGSSASLLPRYLAQTTESKDSLSEDKKISSTELRVQLGSKSVFAKGNNQRLWRIKLNAAKVQDAEDEIALLAEPEDSMRLAVAKAYKPESLISGRLEGAYEWSLGLHGSTGIKLGALAFVADADFVKRILYAPYLHLFIAQKNEVIRTFFAVETYPQFDHERQLITETRQLGRVSLALPSEFFLNLRGSLSEFSYNVETEGADWIGRMFLDLSYGEDDLFVFGSFTEIASGWRLRGIPNVPVVRFDQQAIGLYAKASVPLTSWWRVGADARAAQRSANHIEPIDADKLSPYFPTSINQISVYTEIVKSF